jgi:hypothetical protein
MSEPVIDGQYFDWLYGRIADPGFKDKSLTYWKILRVLYLKEFYWTVDNDENRVDVGKALRITFLNEMGIDRHSVDPHWLDLPCSMFELMVGLANDLSFQAGGKPHYWFWEHLMVNIGLAGFSDKIRFTDIRRQQIDQLLDMLINRQYEPTGLGGFFPLQDPPTDQTKVELWFQLSEYVIERELAG